MNVEVLDTLEFRLRTMFPGKASLLDGVDVGQVRLSAFDFDSLDTLQFAMDIEEALNIQLEAVDFSNESTLSELAHTLSGMVEQQRS